MKRPFLSFWLQFPVVRRLAGLAALGAATWAVAQVWTWTREEIIEHTVVALAPDQIVRLPDFSDTNAFAWAEYALQNPREAWEQVESLRTPEEKALAEWSRLAILDPEGYRQAWREQFGQPPPGETAETAAPREQAHSTILHPYEHAAEREQSLSVEERRREEMAAYAILHPWEFQQLVERYKTPGHRDGEALAALALEHPEEFTAAARRAAEQTRKGAAQ